MGEPAPAVLAVAVPFVTAWMGEHPLAEAPVALYGVILLMNALAWLLLQTVLIRHEGREFDLAKAIKTGLKERISPALYVAGVLAAFVFPPAALLFYVAVAAIWFIPDRRVERQLGLR